MDLNEPQPEDFGLSAEECRRLLSQELGLAYKLAAVAFVLAGFSAIASGAWTGSVKRDLATGITVSGCSFFASLVLLISLSNFAAGWVVRRRGDLRAAHRYTRAIQAYRESCRRFQTLFWLGLRGKALELEVATLYRRSGYKVLVTPLTGDAGVDLLVEKNDEIFLVQCKGYAKPAGPAVIRELLGAMIHLGGRKGIVVCPAGFTKGAEGLAREQSIELLAVSGLLSLVLKAESEGKGELSSQPSGT